MIINIRKIVENLKSELTSLELRNGKIQVQLPKPAKQQKSAKGKNETPKEVKAEVKGENEEKPKQEAKKKDTKKEKKPKAAPAPPVDDKPIDVSRLSMKVGKIIECVKHPGNTIVTSVVD